LQDLAEEFLERLITMRNCTAQVCSCVLS
jgi:hypothetical protein